MLTLDPTKIVFDWPNARACAEASAEAYKLNPFPDTAATLITNSKTDASCFVQERGDCIVIAFEGSNAAKDFICDAFFLLTDFDIAGGGKVHAGFLRDYNSLHPAICKKLLELAPGGIYIANVYTFGCPRTGNGDFRKLYNAAGAGSRPGARPVIITGHSLGGALAILCAVNLSLAFGCDKALMLGQITFDVVNENDIVPRTPPLLMGYRRVGQKIFLFAPAGWGINPSLWMLLLSDAFGFWRAYRKKYDVLITEHFIKAYQQRIQNL